MSDALKLLKDLEQSMNIAEAKVADAEKRRAIAISEANNLENRTNISLKALDEEIDSKRQESLGELNKEIIEKENSVAELTDAENKLTRQLKLMDARRIGLEGDIEALDREIVIRTSDINAIDVKIAESHLQLSNLGDEITSKRKEIESLDKRIGELVTTEQSIIADIKILNLTTNATEAKIMDLDASYKSRKDNYDKQLSKAESQLRILLDKIEQAMNKDKQIRESWAEGHMELDKRTNSVRQMEARLAGAEDRIKELDAYM